MILEQCPMYKLYGDLGSGAAAVELTLCELGIDYQYEHVSLSNNQQKTAEFAQLNPQRKIPALICPDGSIITESVAIILWLMETHPEKPLLPVIGSRERATALRWLIFICAELYQLVEIIDYPERFLPQGADPESILNKTIEYWRKRWQLMDQNIKGPYLLGKEFCVTDIYIAVVSRWAEQDNWRPDNIKNVENIAKLVATRPLCKNIWAKNFIYD